MKSQVHVLSSNPTVVREIQAIVEQLGIKPTTSSPQSLEQADAPPELACLLLIHWPDHPLEPLLRQLRERGFAGPAIAVLSSTAHAAAERLLAAGFADTIQLPTSKAHLGRLLPFHLPDESEDEELKALYVQNAHKHLAALEGAKATGDSEAMVRLAHKIHGSAASFGFHKLGQAARAVEILGKEGRLDEKHCQALIASCRQATQGLNR